MPDVAPATDTMVGADAGGPPSVVHLTLDGVLLSLGLETGAAYSAADQTLNVVAADSAGRTISVGVITVEEFTVGFWSTEDPDAATPFLCFHDGAGPLVSGPTGCPHQTTHQAASVDFSLDAFRGVGSWVEGSFSATLYDAAGERSTLSSGYFRVVREQ